LDNNGISIPAHEREAVFERFTRGSSEHPDGSELGLALIAQQTSLHGGIAELSDSPLGGARLRLKLSGTG